MSGLVDRPHDPDRSLHQRWREFSLLSLPDGHHHLLADVAMQDADVVSLVAIYMGQRQVDWDIYLSVRVNGFALDKLLDDYQAESDEEAALLAELRRYSRKLDELLELLGACIGPDPN